MYLLLLSLRFILTGVVLSVAAHQDYRRGEAKNGLWLYAPVGLLLTALSWEFGFSCFLFDLASMAVLCGISILLFCLGGWGGADTKALLTVAVSLPMSVFSFLPFPLLVLCVGFVGAWVYGLSARKGHVRFLPFFLTGFLVVTATFLFIHI